MAAEQGSASDRARSGRAAAVACALAMLAVAGWLVWRHAIGTLVALDAERTLTLQVFLVANAVALFAAAQPARYVSRPLGVRAALVTAGAAGINVGAAAFFVINAALGSLPLQDENAPRWLIAFFAPAVAALLVFMTSFGARPEGGDEVSDEDIAEAALILTESQRRWSWQAVFEMAGFMALTRTAILAAYFAWLVAGMAMFAWLGKAFASTQPLSSDELRAVGADALARAAEILALSWIWIVFVIVAIAPPLLVLSAAVWYRFRLRRDRARLRAISKTPAARLMLNHELQFLRRRIERPLLAAMKAQRAVS